MFYLIQFSINDEGDGAENDADENLLKNEHEEESLKYPLGRVNFCQKHPNIPAESYYCVFRCTDQPQKISAW